jgi:signal transduction histidine kinase
LKLLTKSTFYFLLLSILVMLAGAALLYLTIKKVIYRQIDESLITEKTIIEDQIRQTDTIPDFEGTFGHQIEVKLLNYHVNRVQSIKDTDIYDTKSDSFIPFRYIFSSGNSVGKKGFIITIFQIISEKNELLHDIEVYMFSLFFSLLLISILINYLIAKRLWRPFYNSVKIAERFDIQSDKLLELPKTDINEFIKLNEVLENMTRKMRDDYLNLKEFGENASHEIQTPLAVMRSKTDLLMQQKNLNKDSLTLIKSINEAITKLFKLNQGLLLISKIENKVFHEKKKVSLKQITVNGLDNYKEIMQLKKIKVEMDASDEALVEMNDMLAEVLISNLLSNAVRFNINGGFIKCHIDIMFLIITNSGLAMITNPEDLFKRFHKNSDNPQSVGLGLSIVKEIAESYGMNITYTCINDVHEIKLQYRQRGNLPKAF